MAITIHGAGCALMDYLYRNIDFGSPAVRRLLRRKPGDGGLHIGGLVFAEALERFAGMPIDEVVRSIVGTAPPDRETVGGPSIVSLIHTAQLLPEATVRYFGAVGADATGAAIRDLIGRTPIDASGLATRDGATPATYVFSDPSFADGHGERMFVNLLGVASHVGPADLGPGFPRADIVQLGGTALVPPLHDELPRLLRDARSAGALTVVNTVFDFRAELDRPGERWPLGADGSYPLVDLLLTDAEEARRLSGHDSPREAAAWFLEQGTGAVIVTDGPAPVWYAASGPRFVQRELASRPVFSDFARRHDAATSGDTTGCGDNFTGGVVAAVASALDTSSRIDLDRAVRLGIASGAFCLTHLGGTFIESRAGEKRERVEAISRLYDEVSA